jgi:uncharacterized membrane protein SpoIIM required for sporulation
MLELPCFWLSVGMGIGLGRALSVPGAYNAANIRQQLAPRIDAYWMIIVPILLVSAIAETIAIRGHIHAKRTAEAPPEDDQPPDEPA